MMHMLETTRLLFRCPEAGDQRELKRVFCDPLMMRYLGGLWTPEYLTGVIEAWRGDWGVERRWSGVLVQKTTGEIVGTVGLTENTLPNYPGFELSWFILPEHQRQGFAFEITVEFLRFAFEDLGAERVVAETDPENLASNGLLQKLGFTCLGECHHVYDDLPELDTQVLWAITRNN